MSSSPSLRVLVMSLCSVSCTCFHVLCLPTLPRASVSVYLLSYRQAFMSSSGSLCVCHFLFYFDGASSCVLYSVLLLLFCYSDLLQLCFHLLPFLSLSCEFNSSVFLCSLSRHRQLPGCVRAPCVLVFPGPRSFCSCWGFYASCSLTLAL